ncbi:hypothetical protein BTS2_0950 [Bacillus sp. TS-2]|nr:hypothetical protein BTS2_0950 [Bacillus sp. TS-2]
MSNKINQLKRDAEQKRRDREKGKRKKELHYSSQDFQERPWNPTQSDYLEQKKDHNNREGVFHDRSFFVLRLFASIGLFLFILIAYNGHFSSLEGAKNVVASAYQQEFQFEMLANWYEDKFGQPLALLPEKENNEKDSEDPSFISEDYAVPASGTIAENFSENGQGILVDIGTEEEAKAIKGGLVIEVGEDEEIGKRVIIQHYDQTESIYGMLNTIDVNIYDHIQAGELIGTIIKEEGKQGLFYFAIKKGEHYIDPSEVISFE